MRSIIIAPFRSSNGDWRRVVKFSFNQKLDATIHQFTKIEVLLFDCDHVEGFQQSEKSETVWFRGTPSQLETWNVGDFHRSQPGYFAMKHN